MLSTLLTTVALFAPVDLPTPPDTVFCQEELRQRANDTLNTIRRTIRRVVEEIPPTPTKPRTTESRTPAQMTPPVPPMPPADDVHTIPPLPPMPFLPTPPQSNIQPATGGFPVPAINGYWRMTRQGWRWITLPVGVPPPPPELGYFYGFDGPAPYGYNYPAFGPRPYVYPFTFRDYQEFKEFQRFYERFRNRR